MPVRTPFSKPWRLLGRPFGWLYGMGAWLHRAAYVYGPLERAHFEPLVIAVGNLSVGGTGKSPHVCYLQALLGAVEQSAMISRGYGRSSKGLRWVELESVPAEVGDEPLQFKRAFPAAAVVVAEQRAEGIREVLAHRPDLRYVLLDDALQHWGVQADCTILLTTFAAPFFQQELLPFGRLREFRNAYKRATVLMVTKCPPDIDAATRARYRAAIQPLSTQALLFSWLAYQPLYDLQTGAVGPSLEQQPLQLLLVTGIADTPPLQAYLEQYQHDVQHQRFPDHHAFSLADLRKLQPLATQRIVVTTEKDAPKLRPLLQQATELEWTIYVLPIQVVLSAEDKATLLAALGK